MYNNYKNYFIFCTNGNPKWKIYSRANKSLYTGPEPFLKCKIQYLASRYTSLSIRLHLRQISEPRVRSIWLGITYTHTNTHARARKHCLLKKYTIIIGS